MSITTNPVKVIREFCGDVEVYSGTKFYRNGVNK